MRLGALVCSLVVGLLVAGEAGSNVPPVPVVDLHVDLPYRSFYKDAPFSDGSGQYRAEHLLEAGVRGVVLPLFVPKDAKPNGRTLAEFERSYQQLFSALLGTAPFSLPGCGVERANGQSRQLTTWLSFEDSGPVEPTDTAISSWILRGVRVFGLVHTEANVLATSSGQASHGQGLSPRGATFVKLVWKYGGVVDVSHASDQATSDMLAMARKHHGRIIATHSNARSLSPHPRNLTDAHIRAIGELGGVIGVNFHGRFLEPKTGRASLNHVVEQIQYMAKLVGVQTIAIGSDFEGGISPPSELKSEMGFPRLARALRRSGFSDAEVRAIFAENALRVLCAGAVSPSWH